MLQLLVQTELEFLYFPHLVSEMSQYLGLL